MKRLAYFSLIVGWLYLYATATYAENTLTQAEYVAEMQSILAEARMSEDPFIEYNLLKSEIEGERLTYKELESSEQEFKNFWVVACLNQPRVLMEKISNIDQPLGFIQKLENTLDKCGLSFESVGVGIDYHKDIAPHQKRGYLVLALEAYNQYHAEEKELHWHKYQKYKRFGGITQREFDEFRTNPQNLPKP